MSRFSTHTNEVNGWLLFSSQFLTSPQSALMTYTRAAAEISLERLITFQTLQSDQFALQYLSATQTKNIMFTNARMHTTTSKEGCTNVILEVEMGL